MATAVPCQVPAVTMPAELMSKLDVSMIKPDEPPPMVVVPVELPVFIWVSKLDEWLRLIGAPVDDNPAKAPWPADVMLPPVVTVKLVKEIKLVPAVVPDKMVSQPVPADMAFEPEPPVMLERLIPVPVVRPAADMSAIIPEVAELAMMLKIPAPV